MIGRLLLWLALGITPATAQPNLMGFPGTRGVHYLGPGDIVAGAGAWYGLRAYSAAVAATGTQKAVNLRRTSDSTTSDILILTTGALDVATASTFCAATTCFVTKWYDQSGNIRDAAQATAANQPQFLFNCLGSFACVSSLTSSSVVLNGSTITPATGVASFSTVAMNTRITNGGAVMIGENATNNRIFVPNTANRWELAGSVSGSILAVASDAAWHAANGALNGASSVLNIDGTDTTGSTTGSTTAASSKVPLGSANDTIELMEAGFWDNISITQDQRNSLRSNQSVWWGI